MKYKLLLSIAFALITQVTMATEHPNEESKSTSFSNADRKLQEALKIEQDKSFEDLAFKKGKAIEKTHCSWCGDCHTTLVKFDGKVFSRGVVCPERVREEERITMHCKPLNLNIDSGYLTNTIEEMKIVRHETVRDKGHKLVKTLEQYPEKLKLSFFEQLLHLKKVEPIQLELIQFDPILFNYRESLLTDFKHDLDNLHLEDKNDPKKDL